MAIFQPSSTRKQVVNLSIMVYLYKSRVLIKSVLFAVKAFRAKRRSRDLETVKAAGLSASSKDNPATETSEQEMANMAA